MPAKTNLHSALAAAGLSTLLFVSQGSQAADSIKQMLASVDSAQNTYKKAAMDVTVKDAQNVAKTSELSALKEPTAQTVTSPSAHQTDASDISPVTTAPYQTSSSKTSGANARFLPTISYTTDNLSQVAKQVNAADWGKTKTLNRATGTKIQALLNWHQNGVGAVDGYWGKNTQKAMQAFQKANNLTISDQLNEETWKALTQDSKLVAQPVLVNYKLTDNDVFIKTATIPETAEEKAKLEGMYYQSVIEGLSEKFHMTQSYLKALNPNSSFKSGDIITVYNPGSPINKAVSRVVADKSTQTLYAYDDKNTLIASYPTTVGSTATPSPSGTHTVSVKVHEPNYTFTKEDGSKLIIPPGPNNPVGLVWIGLSKPSYGIHGSPDPERISRQASAGCVRLTNWDALALLGVIQNGATVEFK
ncbi:MULTISPECIES: L,D-transpeptidase family protein [Psychrobacter]|uniref:L,D-transpeptidase family protein n=1 Tax=Psychrobacter TaxID=497 RepID=UPI00146B0F56|nr:MULTISPECIES: L,D-transpeptidase family protein [Psychrobacter]